ncbi:MAG: hypothetical protein H7Y17_14880, partial [Chlorobia bacterium]|nr:hypothetical protein [Fimbriimonadaceae bacterium]
MTRTVGKAYFGAIRWGVLLAFLNLLVFGFLFFSADATLRGWVSEIAGIAIPLIAAACCFGIKRLPGFKRLSVAKNLPAVLGGAALAYGVGMIAYTYETRFLGRPGNPGWSDLFFLIQYV